MPMELDLGPSARAFRDEVRGWQVQRNIVGERVLGLPKDPAPGGQR